MLSLNHLSLSLITPKDLKRLLTQIKANLPPSLKWPEDHRSNIWYYYHTFTCTTFLEDDRIVVVLVYHPFIFLKKKQTLIDPNQKLLEIRNDTLSRIWEPFVQALPNFTKLELPENLEQVDNIPMNDLILNLRGLRSVKVEDTSWPLWSYILNNLGFSTVITGLLFWYFQYYKKGKHSF